jgi:hypothetical protein
MIRLGLRLFLFLDPLVSGIRLETLGVDDLQLPALVAVGTDPTSLAR